MSAVIKYLSLVSLLTAQSIPPDEIRSHTTPYVPPSSITIRTEVRVVEVPVVIRDSHLRTIAGLTKDDFEIDDNEKRQPITAFSIQTFKPPSEAQAVAGLSKSPRFLALCFDNLHLLPALLAPVKDAAKRFVRTSLAPNHRVAIVRTSRSENSQFIADVPALIEQIEKITSTPQAVFNDSERCVHLAPHEAVTLIQRTDPGDALLHAKMAECSACYHNACPESMITGVANAVWSHNRAAIANTLSLIDSVVDGMSTLPGQRIVVLTSGGFLTRTFEIEVEHLMDKARHAEVLINALDARGLYQNASVGMAYDGMGILANGTGGTFFHNSNSMEEGFEKLGAIPETSYMLGFTPPGAADGSFHKLKVRLAANKGYSVEARLGYTAHPDAPAASTLDAEVTMVAHVDINRLHFKPYEDRRAQKLTIIAVLRDTHGAFVAGKRSDVQVSFKDATFEQFSKSGFTAALTIPAPPGTYSVRAVAQDAMENKLAAATTEVKIK